MVDAPERIRVAQDADGFWTCREAVSGSQEYVRADLYAALEAQLAASLKELSGIPGELVDRVAAAIRDWGSHYDDGPWESLSDERKEGWRSDARRALAVVKEYLTPALSPAPEAQQEAVAYRIHAPEDEHYGTGPDRLQFHPLAQYDLDNGYRQTPLYTRPSEQAVTEAQGWRLVPEEPSDEMVEAVRKKQSEAGFSPDNSEWLRDNYSVMLAAAPTPPERVVTDAMVGAVRKLFLDDVDVWLSDDTIRGALKAAMEAGRHD